MSGPVAVILAAGQGTRMRSSLPKLLHPLCGRPMIGWSVAAARAAGAGRVVVVDGPERRVAEALDEDVAVAVQPVADGTAGALQAAAEQIDGSEVVLVLNGDHPLVSPETLRDLVAAHRRSGAAATIATAILEDPSGYGRVVRAPDGTVERVVETKAPGDADPLELHIREINTGIFAFDGEVLLGALEQIGTENAQGERYLPAIVPILRAGERTVVAHEIADEGAMLGINDRTALARATALAQERILRRHMLAGVTIVHPASTVIEADVELGQDCVVEPFTILRGSTVAGEGAVIGPHSTVIDARVGAGAAVVHSHVVGADIGERVSVGPFAYLRPGATLREGAKAGTFVEIKNSEIGPGSKVPHLSYIGDTDIGERTNIGAGTITANYDGANKNRTRIGSRVFVGVDNALVAPVTLGDDSYTGAGSVIVDDVPPGALGVARQRQRNIEGYVERRRAAKPGDS